MCMEYGSKKILGATKIYKYYVQLKFVQDAKKNEKHYIDVNIYVQNARQK